VQATCEAGALLSLPLSAGACQSVLVATGSSKRMAGVELGSLDPRLYLCSLVVLADMPSVVPRLSSTLAATAYQVLGVRARVSVLGSARL